MAMRVNWRNWSTEEVCEWLSTHDLLNVAEQFQKSNLNGRNLETLETHDLKSFDLSKKEIAKVSFLLVLLHRSHLHPEIKPISNGGAWLPPHQFCDRVALEFLSRPFGFQVSLESDLEHSLNYPRVSTINNLEIAEAGVGVGMYITSINQEPIELGATLATLTHLLSETSLPCTIVFAQSKRQPPGYDEYYNPADYQPRRISSVINLQVPGIYSNFEDENNDHVNNDDFETTPPRQKQKQQMQQQQQQLPKNKNMDNGNLKNNSNTKIESMKKQQNNYNHHTHQHQHHQTNHNHHHHLHPHSHQNQHHHLSPHPPTHNHISTQRRGYSSQQDLTSDDGDMYQWKKRTTVETPKRKLRQPSSTEVMLITGELISKVDAQSCHDCGRWCKDDDAICATDDNYYCELCFDSHKCQKCGIWSVGVNTKLMLDLCEECKNTVRSTWAETPSELEALERETFIQKQPTRQWQEAATQKEPIRQWQDVIQVYDKFPFDFTITPTDPFPLLKDVDGGLDIRNGDTICSVNEVDVRGRTAGQVVSVLAKAGETFPITIGFMHTD